MSAMKISPPPVTLTRQPLVKTDNYDIKEFVVRKELTEQDIEAIGREKVGEYLANDAANRLAVAIFEDGEVVTVEADKNLEAMTVIYYTRIKLLRNRK